MSKELKEVEFHELSNMFPLVTGKPFDDLVEDIKKNGLLEPIVKLDGKIIDGRTRYLACKKAGIEPIYREYSLRIEPIDYIVSTGLMRRHLTPIEQIEIASKILAEKEKVRQKTLAEIKEKKPEIKTEVFEQIEKKKDITEVAKQLNITPKAVEEGVKLIQQIERGENNELKEEVEKEKKKPKEKQVPIQEVAERVEKSKGKAKKPKAPPKEEKPTSAQIQKKLRDDITNSKNTIIVLEERIKNQEEEIRILKNELDGRKQEVNWVLDTIHMAMKYGYDGKGTFSDDRSNNKFITEWYGSRVCKELRSFKIRQNRDKNKGDLICEKDKEIITNDLEIEMHHVNSARFQPELSAKIDNVLIYHKKCHDKKSNGTQ